MTNQNKEQYEKIVEAYCNVVKQGNKFPTRSDLSKFGISRDMFRHYFVNLSALRVAAKSSNPNLFSGVVDEDKVFSKAYAGKLSKVVSSHKRFFVTSVVNGQSIPKSHLESVQLYCKKKNAVLLLIPCNDPAHNLDNTVEWHFDDSISDENFVFDELKLNSNIHISSIRVNAKQINPTTGLGRIVQNKGSAIFGSPKQSLEHIPVSNTKYPHAMMSTGAITAPNYKTTRGNSLRSAYIADYDHVMGGLIVEIQDDNIYHCRQIQFDKDGSFIDLGKRFSSVGISTPAGPIALVMGDYHVGDHDPSAVKAWREVCNEAGVNVVVFHDLFNGRSISHHTQEKAVTRAKLANNNQLNLANELFLVGSELSSWGKYKRVVVKSNHDEWIDRYIEDGRMMRDSLNLKTACAIAGKMIDGEDPLKVGLSMFGGLSRKELSSILFLKRDEDFKIGGHQLAAHGDLGANGSKGSRANLERCYNSAVIGHNHSAGILRSIYQAGTTTYFNLDYNRGPSNWTQSSCLVYSNGSRQLIHSIRGAWKL